MIPPSWVERGLLRAAHRATTGPELLFVLGFPAGVAGAGVRFLRLGGLLRVVALALPLPVALPLGMFGSCGGTIGGFPRRLGSGFALGARLRVGAGLPLAGGRALLRALAQ